MSLNYLQLNLINVDFEEEIKKFRKEQIEKAESLARIESDSTMDDDDANDAAAAAPIDR